MGLFWEKKMKFKFGKSLKNDYIFLLSLTFVIICIGLLIFYSIGPQAYRLIDIKKIIQNGFDRFDLAEAIVFIIFVIMIVLSFILFIKRFFYIKSFTDNYKTVIGKVVDINYIKDRCGVDIEFMFEGNICKKHFALMNNSQTKYIHMDSEVELIIKDENPKKVLITELYFEENGIYN